MKANRKEHVTVLRQDWERLCAENAQLKAALSEQTARTLAVASDVSTAKTASNGQAQTPAAEMERLRIEKILAESEARFRTLLEGMHTCVVVCGPSGEILMVNRSVRDLVGATEAQVVGRSPFDPDWEIFDENGARMPLQDRLVPKVLATHQPIRNAIVGVNRYDTGERVWLIANAEPFFNSEGELTMVVATADDITALKRAEEALAESEARFRTLLEEMHTCVIVHGPRAEVLMINRAFRDLIGATEAQLIGKTPFEHFWEVFDENGQLIPLQDRFVFRVLATRQPLRNIITGITRFDTGERVWLMGNVEPLFNSEGELTMVVATAADITALKRAEEALAESEARFRTLLEEMHISVMLYGPRAEVLMVNRATCTILGRTEAQILGRSAYDDDWEVFDENGDRVPAERRVIPRVLATRGSVQNVVIGVNRRDTGERIWVLASAKPFQDPDGNITMVVETLSDITAMKRAEEALRVSEERLQAALTGSSDGLYDVDLTTEQTYYSPRFLELLGFAGHEEELSPQLEEFGRRLHPEDRAAALQCLNDSLSIGTPFHAEYRLRCRDGEYRWFQARGDVQRDAAGNPVRLAGFLTDITQAKLAEAALRESEVRFRVIFESAAIGIALVGLDGRLLEANPVLCEMLGYSHEELCRMSFTEFTHPEDVDRDWALFQEILQGKRDHYQIEKRYHHKDGSLVWGRLTASTVRDAEGQLRFGIGMVEDITERKQAEQALQNSLTQLHVLTSHLQSVREEERASVAREVHDELGQALTGLKIDLAWLKRNLQRDRKAVSTQTLIEKMEAMNGLIEATIKTVRRIATELRPAILDTLGLVPALEWVAQDFQGRTGIACEFRSSVETIDLDQDRMTAVFRICQESLTNVLRHAQATRVRVRLDVRGGTLILRVKDNGKGIRQADLTAPRSFGVLSMRERAQLLGGELQIVGVPKKGTTVILHLPMQSPAQRPETG